MLTLFAKHYAADKEEVTADKFIGKKCHGYYRRHGTAIRLYDLTMTLRAEITVEHGIAVLNSVKCSPGKGITRTRGTSSRESKWMEVPNRVTELTDELNKTYKQLMYDNEGAGHGTPEHTIP